jgi:Skp family chaperone for outer membrane proteins
MFVVESLCDIVVRTKRLTSAGRVDSDSARQQRQEDKKKKEEANALDSSEDDRRSIYASPKKQIIEKLTDAMVSIVG